MDLFSLSFEYLLNCTLFRNWPQMKTLAESVIEKKPRNCSLPAISCEAVGATSSEAALGVAAITCLQIGILLIDDMLDSDPRGLYRQIGSAAAANLASAFQAAGLEAVIRSQVNLEIKLEILTTLNRMIYKTALGQYWDVQNLTSEEGYWIVVKTKSAPFFQAGLQMGALLGDAPFETAEEIGKLGAIYGEMIQLHDDINDALEVPAGPDWLSGRQSLPLLFASTVEHPERERFVELRQIVSDEQALAEAQLILFRCGAISYVFYELLERFDKAQEVLQKLDLPCGEKLEALFDEIIEPVQELMMEVESR